MDDIVKNVNLEEIPKFMRAYDQFEFRFNLMDLSEEKSFQNRFAKISFTEEGTFGNYDLA